MFYKGFWYSKKTAPNEAGAILILTALLITAIITFLALAVDLSMFYTHSMESGTIASDSAFGALEAYGLMPPTSTFVARKNRAKVRAREIVGLALNKKLGDDFLQGGGTGSQAIICYDNETLGDCNNPNHINGRIRDGRYHWAEPGGPGGCGSYGGAWNNQVCPCGAGGGGAFTGPCFEQNDPSLIAGSASAFQITLGTQRAVPVKSIFGGLLSAAQTIEAAEGTATAVPRKVEFLVDTSGSLIRDNELRNEDHGSEAALALNSAVNTCVDGTTVCQVNDLPFPTAESCTFQSAFHQWKWYQNDNTFGGPGTRPAIQSNRAAYDSANYSPVGPATSNALFSQYHFKDDFRCRVRTYQECSGCIDDDINNCGSCANRTDYYLVDEYRDFTAGGSTEYYGAEPLFSVLNGINVAIQTIKARGTPGDSVGARFFDSSASLFNVGYPNTANDFMRSYPLTSIINSDPNNAAAQLEDATEVTSAATNPLEQSNRTLFPRTGVFTNLPEALTVSMNIFAAQPDFESSQGMVVIFTDGRTNCTAGVCNNIWASHQASMNEAMSIITSQYVPTKVSVHWFIVGKATGQHHLLRKTGNDTCMTDEDARYGGYSWTDQDYDLLGQPPLFHDYGAAGDYADQWAGQQSGDIPFMPFANQLYDAALLTQGVWETIRTCCDGSCSGVPTNITSLCLGGVAGDLVTSGGGILPGADQLDGEGRLLCDPENRSTRIQIEDGMVDIFSKSPYVLVK